MLKFVGNGSAFNYKLGNNCAYIKTGKTLVLIDCGNTTFSRLLEFGILDGIDDLYVLITHMHPDHIGSLGDLIFYCNYISSCRLSVCTPEIEDVTNLLMQMGVEKKLYSCIDLKKEEYIVNKEIELKVNYVAVPHVNIIWSYAYIIETNGERIYYSGDSSNIDKGILHELKIGAFDYFYQDTFMGPLVNVPHLTFERLCELVEINYRSKVYCMHLDESFDAEYAKGKGFNVVKNLQEKCEQPFK